MRSKSWNCPKCGGVPSDMVKMKGDDHVCKICGSVVSWSYWKVI